MLATLQFTHFDRPTCLLLAGTFGMLGFASAIGWVVRRRARGESASHAADNLIVRIRAWWVMVALFTSALALGPVGVTRLFAIASLLALGEMLPLLRVPPTVRWPMVPLVAV